LKLEAAGYVDVVKGYNGRKPETTVSLTGKGRDALLEYRGQLLSALAPLAGD
jgi:DNA-binding PadR family transcriptional regulator